MQKKLGVLRLEVDVERLLPGDMGGWRLDKALRDVGAVPNDLAALAATAASLKRLMALSPISPSEADLRRILEASF